MVLNIYQMLLLNTVQYTGGGGVDGLFDNFELVDNIFEPQNQVPRQPLAKNCFFLYRS